jgi:hypothetical protein
MRLESLLLSFVRIDRATLIRILSKEAEELARRAASDKSRTEKQRRSKQEAIETFCRVEQILTFLNDGSIPEAMAESDRALCKSLESKISPG